MGTRINVKEACRLCLQDEGKISVFEDDLSFGSINAESVFRCVSVKIEKDDKLPKRICTRCQLSVEGWATFKIACERSQELLDVWLRDDLLDQKEIILKLVDEENVREPDSASRLNEPCQPVASSDAGDLDASQGGAQPEEPPENSTCTLKLNEANSLKLSGVNNDDAEPEAINTASSFEPEFPSSDLPEFAPADSETNTEETSLKPDQTAPTDEAIVSPGFGPSGSPVSSFEEALKSYEKFSKSNQAESAEEMVNPQGFMPSDPPEVSLDGTLAVLHESLKTEQAASGEEVVNPQGFMPSDSPEISLDGTLAELHKSLKTDQVASGEEAVNPQRFMASDSPEVSLDGTLAELHKSLKTDQAASGEEAMDVPESDSSSSSLEETFEKLQKSPKCDQAASGEEAMDVPGFKSSDYPQISLKKIVEKPEVVPDQKPLPAEESMEVQGIETSASPIPSMEMTLEKYQSTSESNLAGSTLEQLMNESELKSSDSFDTPLVKAGVEKFSPTSSPFIVNLETKETVENSSINIIESDDSNGQSILSVSSQIGSVTKVDEGSMEVDTVSESLTDATKVSETGLEMAIDNQLESRKETESPCGKPRALSEFESNLAGTNTSPKSLDSVQSEISLVVFKSKCTKSVEPPNEVLKELEYVDLCSSNETSDDEDENDEKSTPNTIVRNDDSTKNSESLVLSKEKDEPLPIGGIEKALPGDSKISTAPKTSSETNENIVEIDDDTEPDTGEKESVCSDRDYSMPPPSVGEDGSNLTGNSADREEEDDQLVFTTSVTINVNPFSEEKKGNAADSQESSTPDADCLKAEGETTVAAPVPTPPPALGVTSGDQREVVSSTVEACSEGEKKAEEKEGEVSSSVEKPSAPSPHPPGNSDELPSVSSLEKEPVTNIKEEPIDSTTMDTPTTPPFLRVKSEFSTFNFNDEPLDEQAYRSRREPSFSGNPDDPNNTECIPCQRKYSSTSNYRAHLLTKMHLFNTGQSVQHIPKECLPELPLNFESPLLRSRLSTEPLIQSPYYEQPYDPPVPTSPIRPPRRPIDHCALCNVSFTFPAEIKRHLHSKKHRLNERIARYRQQAHPNIPGPPVPRLYPPEPAPSSSLNPGGPSSIFICPMQSCRFSCSNGDDLLIHMKAHGFEQPLDSPREDPRSKLSYRQQEMMRREADLRMKREAEMRMKREAELRMKREAELRMRREAEIRMKREAEMRMKREAEMRLKREAEMRKLREAELKMKRDAELRIKREAESKIREAEIAMKREAEMKRRREAELELMRDPELRQQLEEQDRFNKQMLGHLGRSPSKDSFGRFQCEGCHRPFVRESGLKKHSWYCTALSDTLKQKGEMDLEEDIEEIEDLESEGTGLSRNEPSEAYEAHCPLCDISFTARNVFINHVQIYHKGSYLESCIPKASSPMDIPQKLTAKPPPARQPPKPVAKAPVVPVSNKMRITNKTHGFNCEICGKKFNLLSSLNFHLKTHTSGVRHICRICKEPFSHRKAFTEHCRQHFLKPGSKETLCHKCFKVFKTRSELYQHKKNDQCSIKLKIYSCNICEHSFKEPAALEEHKVRCHSESLDISEANDESFGEHFDDSMIDDHFMTLREDDNQPSTSSRNSSTSGRTPISEARDASPMSVGSDSLRCHSCNRNFSSKQSLKKHTLTFHMKAKFNPVKAKYKKSSDIDPGKPWKCRHCNSARFMTRKTLVAHLKKCDYNTVIDVRGICLQCGDKADCGKSRICQSCLPEMAKDPNFEVKRSKTLQKSQRSGEKLGQEELSELQKAMKEKFLNSGDSVGTEDSEDVEVKVEGETKKEKPPPKSRDSVEEVQLMKCPIGNKYFRNELVMLRHYSECDGSCENRCTRCRKPFNTPKEYKIHLLTSSCDSRKMKKSKLRYPTFACKRKKPRRDHSASSLEQTVSVESETWLKPPELSTDKIPEDLSDNTMSTYSEETNAASLETSVVNKELEEKCIKYGRVCTVCNKVITNHRAYYRHYYACVKADLVTKESLSCEKCNVSFSKHIMMKGNASAIKVHILKCHFIPYYYGEGLLEDGSRSNVAPEHICYICSFGFSTHDSMMTHIKHHRFMKDEVNAVMLQMEQELLSDERMSSDETLFSYYIDNIQIMDSPIVARIGKSLGFIDSKVLASKSPSAKIYKCDYCSRKFLNKNKYYRHKRVHGIVQNCYEVEANTSEVAQEEPLPKIEEVELKPTS